MIGRDVLLALLAVLAVLDVATTLRALRKPGLREANPLLGWAMRHGRLWIVLKLAATAAGAWLLRDAPAGLALICALYAAVALNNWRQVRRLE